MDTMEWLFQMFNWTQRHHPRILRQEMFAGVRDNVTIVQKLFRADTISNNLPVELFVYIL